ncbi:NFACT RNA binding domain-containing protein [Algivirga pacifica]|uniref:NFACT RNA binding domain-containing protein n=1 Tax=Algivirga pacifica TaxID=1162670 RepID=A0ABP9CWX7_9BACT
MFNNYYFLRQLSAALAPAVQGLELATCFSQNKDELILGFCDDKREFWIRAALIPNVNLLTFPKDFHRSKRNSVELFKEVLGVKVLGTTQYLNERAFSIDMEQGYQLVFKMYGNRSNIILTKKQQAIALFQNRHQEDLQLNTATLNRPLVQTKEQFLAEGLGKCYPTLGKEAKGYLKEQGFDDSTPTEQWQLVEKLIQQLEAPSYHITEWQEVTQFILFEAGNVLKTLNNPIEAANEFFYEYSRDFFLQQEKQPLLKMLRKKITQGENYVLKNLQKLEELEHHSRHEEIANIIMANLHQIPGRSKKVTLFDFYQEKDIKIRLNETLTPQKNAENYYRKAKNQKIEIERLTENIKHKEQELATLKKHIEILQELNNVKELKKYAKAEGILKLREQQNEDLFRNFHFMGFDILVGKSAANNDLLTQKYAKNNDLWLHARDVSGSHVVIKYQAGKNFPLPVIEKAASLAAYYSQRKTDSLCPVIYTPKKFVRKRKGDPAGAVMVDKEQVIMIEPERWSE